MWRSSQAACQGQVWGRCSVTRRALRAIRAGTLMRWARIVAVVARAWKAPARVTGGPGEVVGDRPQHQSMPRCAVKTPLGRWASAEACRVGDDLLDDGVVAVLALGLQHLEPRVTNTAWWRHMVNSSPCPGRATWGSCVGLGARPAGRGLPVGGLGRERGVGDLGDLGVGDQFPGLDVHERLGVVDRGPGVLSIRVIAALTSGFVPVVTDTTAP